MFQSPSHSPWILAYQWTFWSLCFLKLSFYAFFAKPVISSLCYPKTLLNSAAFLGWWYCFFLLTYLNSSPLSPLTLSLSRMSGILWTCVSLSRSELDPYVISLNRLSTAFQLSYYRTHAKAWKERRQNNPFPPCGDAAPTLSVLTKPHPQVSFTESFCLDLWALPPHDPYDQ